jgi:hypothetical protein
VRGWLRTDHIDLYQMHHVDLNTPWDEIWEAMEVLRRQGKIIYTGSSNHAGWHLAQGQEAANQALLHNSEARARFAARVAEVGKGRVIDPCHRPTKVVFAILPKRDEKGRMPRQITPDSLFPLAQVALANAAKLLNSYGIAVEVIGVAVASLDQAA